MGAFRYKDVVSDLSGVCRNVVEQMDATDVFQVLYGGLEGDENAKLPKTGWLNRRRSDCSHSSSTSAKRLQASES